MYNNQNADQILHESLDSILDAIHEDILISDEQGVILHVSPTFENAYNLKKEKALGRTVYDLEQEGYFRPSIISKVIESGEPITMRQKTNNGKILVVTAVPIYDASKRIHLIVSFSRDITEFLELQEQYSQLENKMEQYTEEIHQLRQKTRIQDGVIANSRQMADILETIYRVADFDASILFLGPSGVGKTMLAKIVHQHSKRKNGPFIDINCAAIPENLLESELFGYEKGSFTGANAAGKIGLIELANEGTLLLDEISEMPLSLQAKLLKTIQDKVVTRIGGTKEIKVDFRLITASNRDLEAFSDKGYFRKDLFYRLNVISIQIPPLKDRPDDIIPLVKYFNVKNNEKYGLHKQFHPSAIEALVNYSWPGNIRELSNVVERSSMISEGDIIYPDTLSPEIFREELQIPEHTQVNNLNKTLEEVEGKIIREAWSKYQNTVAVGKALGISQPTAYRKINKYIKNADLFNKE